MSQVTGAWSLQEWGRSYLGEGVRVCVCGGGLCVSKGGPRLCVGRGVVSVCACREVVCG
jgi:hypothetical protein